MKNQESVEPIKPDQLGIQHASEAVSMAPEDQHLLIELPVNTEYLTFEGLKAAFGSYIVSDDAQQITLSKAARAIFGNNYVPEELWIGLTRIVDSRNDAPDQDAWKRLTERPGRIDQDGALRGRLPNPHRRGEPSPHTPTRKSRR